MRGYILALLCPLILMSECTIDYKMMYSIADNERHRQKEVGYPYLISFNNQPDRFKLKPKHQAYMLDTRTLDCKSQQLCAEIATYLINKQKVTNMDMGAFQICYRFHSKKLAVANFFSLKESFVYAKEFAQNLVNKNGCSWQALARYHSATKNLNSKYARNLKHAYYSN